MENLQLRSEPHSNRSWKFSRKIPSENANISKRASKKHCGCHLPLVQLLGGRLELGALVLMVTSYLKDVELGLGSTCSILHNSDCFPRVHEFIPRTWLLGNDEIYDKGDINKAKIAFVPFSIGARACTGKSLAMAELQTTIAASLLSTILELLMDQRES